jgi:ribulose-5-phosphate 4-epimerase/fuculose-1-phosphate aldolase
MSKALDEARYELALANRIIAHEGVLDGFGHVSIRHPDRPDRYLLARSRSPELIEPSDLLEFTLDSEPVVPPKGDMYGERVIHGCIYQARSDVNAVCHHHSQSVLPFCVTGVALEPVFHMGPVMGQVVPFWDSRDEFGDTDLMVVKPEEGHSLARALGPHWMVLMRRHGATVAGTDLRQLAFRTVFGCHNAKLQSEAMAHGHVDQLSPGEQEITEAGQLQQMPIERAWDYWVRHIEKAGLMPAAPAKRKVAAAAKPAARKSGGKAKAAKNKSAGKKRR